MVLSPSRMSERCSRPLWITASVASMESKLLQLWLIYLFTAFSVALTGPFSPLLPMYEENF
jgi:hypothetical protein